MDQLAQIDKFINDINNSADIDSIFEIIQQKIIELGFEYYIYEIIWPIGDIIQTNCSSDWVSHYIANRYCRDDIVLRLTPYKAKPFLWTEITKSRFLTDQQTNVLQEAGSAGLQNGATVPIHGPGDIEAYVMVANSVHDIEFAKLFLDRRHELHLLSTYAHERVVDLTSKNEKKLNDPLSPRELEVLKWSALGKGRWEISKILSISEETVKAHIENACRKLRVKNKTHAVATAMHNGIIAL